MLLVKLLQLICYIKTILKDCKLHKMPNKAISVCFLVYRSICKISLRFQVDMFSITRKNDSDKITGFFHL